MQLYYLMMNKFCAKCGRENDLIDEFCRECFAKENSLLKHFKELNIVICDCCGNYLYKNAWQNRESINLEKNIEEIAAKLFSKKIVLEAGAKLKKLKIQTALPKKLKVGNKSNVNINLSIEVIGSIKDVEIKESYEVPMQIKFSTCNNCKKTRGHYYEATLQIRPKSEKVLRFVEEHCKNKKNLFISKVVENEYGYDVYLSEQKEARNLGNILKKKFKGEIKESKKIFGRKDGRDIYRGTVAFRLE